MGLFEGIEIGLKIVVLVEVAILLAHVIKKEYY